jgi:hypothetical protein
MEDEKKWYEMEESERKVKVYGKFPLKVFWDFWADNKNRVMEIRIKEEKEKDHTIKKSVKDKYNYPYSASGIYVKSYEELRNVVAMLRDKTVMWYGVNPKRMGMAKWGKKSFGGGDAFTEEIAFLPIDIDRCVKNGPATLKDLENANALADHILEALRMENWAESYLKICSGHGVQLLIKLDEPIKLPIVKYEKIIQKNITTQKDETIYMPIPNPEFERMKKIIYGGIGIDIMKFAYKYQKELLVEIDKSVFKLSQPLALHCTKNFKYDTVRWRSIVEMKDGKNNGLSTHILNRIDNMPLYKQNAVFVKRSASNEYLIDNEKFFDHPLIKFLVEYPLQRGMINNYLVVSAKALIRDSKISFDDENVRRLKTILDKKYNFNFNFNVPKETYNFSIDTINKYFLLHGVDFIYKYRENYLCEVEIGIEKPIVYECKSYSDDKMKLPDERDIEKDMEYAKKFFVGDDGQKNSKVIGNFINACIDKYGESLTRFYCDKGVLEKGFKWTNNPLNYGKQ